MERAGRHAGTQAPFLDDPTAGGSATAWRCLSAYDAGTNGVLAPQKKKDFWKAGRAKQLQPVDGESQSETRIVPNRSDVCFHFHFHFNFHFLCPSDVAHGASLGFLFRFVNENTISLTGYCSMFHSRVTLW
mmetsp:Transcript_27518/g.75129  ORF Transcript_27518/g.75129 Transcript_27518/m.75129 type:complete len:131 (+) Transcript_27518:1448-1840(+)